jgi:hypothetical protein
MANIKSGAQRGRYLVRLGCASRLRRIGRCPWAINPKPPLTIDLFLRRRAMLPVEQLP